MTNPAAMPAGFRVSSPDDAPTALARLGLTVDAIHSSLAAGEIGAGNITKFHPRIAAGTTRWSDTVARLRAQLVEREWDMAEPKNSPRIVSPDGTISLMVVGGNSDTGVVDGQPRTARKKGPATREAVEANQLLLPFPVGAYSGIGVSAEGGEAQEAIMQNWILLYFRSATPNETRVELSLPDSITEDFDIRNWRQRIVLRAMAHDLTPLARDAGGADDVDFKIDPR